MRGRQSRKTLAAWEMGQSTPRQRYRIPFAVYLLRDLKLDKDLARFDRIFAMLVDEWLWPLLEDDERAACLRQAAEGQTPLLAMQWGQGGADDTNAISARGESLAENTSAVRVWLTAQRMFAGVAVLLLAFIFYIFYTRFLPVPTAGEAIATLAAPMTALPSPSLAPTVAPTVAPTSTPAPDPLENLDFESGFAPWYFVGDEACDYTVPEEGGTDNRGRYLSIQRTNQACISLRKELGLLPKTSQSVGVALWVRAPDDPYCPSRGDGPAFCPDEPARRAFAAVVMVRSFAAAPQYPSVD